MNNKLSAQQRLDNKMKIYDNASTINKKAMLPEIEELKRQVAYEKEHEM